MKKKMLLHRYLLNFVVILSLFAWGCASKGNDDDDDDVAIKMSAELAEFIPTEKLTEISEAVKNEPGCQKSKGSIDIILAQGCLVYQNAYLFPDTLPENLDEHDTVEQYAGLMHEQDRFTGHISAERFQTVIIPSLQGEKSSIGMILEIKNNEDVISEDAPLRITQIIPYSRAWVDGLQKEDYILEIDGSSLVGLSLQEAVKLLPTEEAASVDLKLMRAEEELEVKTASETHIAGVLEGEIAYLNFRSFTSITADAVIGDYEALVEEQGSSFEKLIIDVRDNGGGPTEEARKIADFFIKKDAPNEHLLMKIEDKNGESEEFYLEAFDKNIEGFSKSQIVLLVDEGSASSSEIFSNTLVQYEAATLIGNTTYGKGVQNLLTTLYDGSGLLVTSDLLSGLNDSTWHLSGVVPDYCVITPADDKPSMNDDKQLQAAISFLNEQEVSTSESCTPNAARYLDVAPQEDPMLKYKQLNIH